ncbi:IclR family transcriptional regulator [Streptomyces sp. INA 01156]
MKELVEWGALERDEQGRYTVGLRLWEVAQNAGRHLRDTARPYLQDLFSLTHETAHIAIRDGDEALYIDRIYGSTRVPRASRVGGRLPLHATAVGKVLLAYEEEWVRAAYLDHRLEAATRHTHVNPGRLAAELRRVRDEGYATTQEEVRAGSCSIAVPVRIEPHPAAIGLVMLSSDGSTMTRHLQALRGIARRIEAAAVRPAQPRPHPATAGPRTLLTLRGPPRCGARTTSVQRKSHMDLPGARGHDEVVVTRRRDEQEAG